MIRNVGAVAVFNSIGKKTLSVNIETDRGFYTASVPCGTSRGSNEAKDLPVDKAIKALSRIRSNLIGLDETDWQGFDAFVRQIDGTPGFKKIGGNLALALSMAVAKAGTDNRLWKLNKGVRAAFPFPVANIIGGGKHGGSTNWQEFLAIPHKAKNPMDAQRILIELWSAVGDELKSKGLLIGRNMENAWMSKLDDLETLYFLIQIAEDWDVRLGVDFAASSFWDGKAYRYKRFGKGISPDKHMALIMEAAREYNLYFLEDPFHEDDFEGFAHLTSKVRNKSLVVGDDLYTTNTRRLEHGIKAESSNGIIIKPNQIGNLSLSVQAIELARSARMAIIPSHRSTETDDTWLADLAVTFDAPLIKIGVLGPDLPKHNRLACLWEEIPDVKMARLP